MCEFLQKKILFKIQFVNVLENEFGNKKGKSTFLALPPRFRPAWPKLAQRQHPLSPFLSLSLPGRARLSSLSPNRSSTPVHAATTEAPPLPRSPPSLAPFESCKHEALSPTPFHSLFASALCVQQPPRKLSPKQHRDRRTPSRRFKPPPPPFFTLVSSPPLLLPSHIFYSRNGALLRGDRGAPASSIAVGHGVCRVGLSPAAFRAKSRLPSLPLSLGALALENRAPSCPSHARRRASRPLAMARATQAHPRPL